MIKCYGVISDTFDLQLRSDLVSEKDTFMTASVSYCASDSVIYRHDFNLRKDAVFSQQRESSAEYLSAKRVLKRVFMPPSGQLTAYFTVSWKNFPVIQI